MPLVADPEETQCIWANIVTSKVEESIYQTSPFWTLFLDPGILFGSTLSTLDLSWNSLCPRVAALLGNGPIQNHSGGKKDCRGKVYHAEGPPQLRVRTAGLKRGVLRARSLVRVRTAAVALEPVI